MRSTRHGDLTSEHLRSMKWSDIIDGTTHGETFTVNCLLDEVTVTPWWVDTIGTLVDINGLMLTPQDIDHIFSIIEPIFSCSPWMKPNVPTFE